MKLNFYQLVLKWSAVSLSCLTMVLSPVAMGKEAEKVTKTNIANAVKVIGLQKKQTIGEVWDKVKGDLPDYMVEELAELVKENRNMQMPELSLDTLKNTTGEEVPVMRLTQNGKTDTIQFYGEANKFIKYNGVVLSINDIQRPHDAAAKIEASDIKLKQETIKYQEQQFRKEQNKNYKKDFARFKGFPRVTPMMWKSMTPYQRAEFITTMRLTWKDAGRVNAMVKDSKAVPSKKSKKSSSIQNFLKVIFGDDANAFVLDNGPGSVKAVPPAAEEVKRACEIAGVKWQGECVVAGYVGRYGDIRNVNSGESKSWCGCSVYKGFEKYPEDGFVEKANVDCQVSNKKDTFVACNPIIYGYKRAGTDAPGKPICVDTMERPYLKATWYDGPCDPNSRLGADSLRFEGSGAARYRPEERAQQLATLENEQGPVDEVTNTPKDTQAYLDSILAADGKNSLAEYIKLGKWDEQIDNQLVGIQRSFEAEITNAMKVCTDNIVSEGANHEDKQVGACDQLHRRWLFAEQAIAKYRIETKACDTTAVYSWSYSPRELVSSNAKKSEKNKTTKDEFSKMEGSELPCECKQTAPTGGGSQAEPSRKFVNFGVSCNAAPPVTPPATCELNGAVGDDCKCLYAPAENGVCPPLNNYKCELSPPHLDEKTCQCKDGYKPENGKCVKKILPILFGILAGVLVVGVIACVFKIGGLCKKKDKKTDPPQPPGPVCGDPNFLPDPNKVCRCSIICVPPMTANTVSCACVPPTVQLCPDGVTPITPGFPCPTDPPRCPNGALQPPGGITSCPTCPGGGYVPENGCPTTTCNGQVVPVGTVCPPANEGGQGDNPNDRDSGGVPTGI